MALVKCPDCSNEMSSQAASCPHCGCPKETASLQPPSSDLQAGSGSSPAKSKFGCSGFFALMLLFVGVISVGMGVFGFTTQKPTGEATVITRGWLRAAIEKKPELEVKEHYKDAEADAEDRRKQAFFGMVCTVGGLWIFAKKYRIPQKGESNISTIPERINATEEAGKSGQEQAARSGNWENDPLSPKLWLKFAKGFGAAVVVLILLALVLQGCA